MTAAQQSKGDYAFLFLATKASRTLFATATLILNVLPWDIRTYPSGEVPDHFIPYDLVLEEVAEYLAPC